MSRAPAPVRRLPTEGLASEPGKMTETERARIYTNLERFRREDAAGTRGGASAQPPPPAPPNPYDDWTREFDTPGPITQANERMGVFEGTPAPENWRPRPDFSAADPSTRVPPRWSPVTEFPPAPVPAGPVMDATGLIRPPSADERALQAGGPRPRLPTQAQPIDPTVAAQIRRTPVVIVDPRSPPVYVSPSGVRIWAVR